MSPAVAFRAEELLAGPIVRRVETDRVSVWVAHSHSPPDSTKVSVTLRIWPHAQGPTGDPLGEATVDSIRVGKQLWFALPTVTFGSGARLLPGKIYGYDVVFGDDGLGDLGLLEDTTVAGHRHLALGYGRGFLPTFRTPPGDAHELVFAHGSCRKTGGPGPDALVALDQIIERNRENEQTRPHYLFLTGDQIYADDPTPELLHWMSDLAQELIGTNERAESIERMRLVLPLSTGPRTIEFPADKFHFPPARRQRLLARAAGLSSEDNWQHAISFGEIAAEYLLTFSNVAWKHHLDDPGEWKELLAERGRHVRDYLEHWRATFAKFYARRTARRAAGHKVPDSIGERLAFIDAWRLLPLPSRAIDQVPMRYEADDWNGDEKDWKAFWDPAVGPAPDARAVIGSGPTPTFLGDPDEQEGLAQLLTPAWYAGAKHYSVMVSRDYTLEANDLPPADVKDLELESDHAVNNLRRLRVFYQGLPNVRRALANVSTLMMFDDHEVTDDWAADRNWVDGVDRTDLGRNIVMNGLVAYALFQDWGNDPDRYTRDTPNKKLLDLAQQMFFDEAGQARENGPDVATRVRLEGLFTRTPPDSDRAFWALKITNPDVAPYEILLLDSRTRRGYDTGDGAPAPISLGEITAQIPAQGPADSKVTIVVSPLPLLGFPPVEQLKPLGVMKAEFTSNPAKLGTERLSKLGVFPQILKDYNFGKMEFDPDPWAFHPAALEAVLARLSTRPAVLLLSGDIHFAMSAKLTYWKTSPTGLVATTRLAQLVSSALRNEPGIDRRKYVQLGVAEQIGAILSGPYDRLGWTRAAGAGPHFDTDSYVLRRLLQTEPVLIPTRMLPAPVFDEIRRKVFMPAPEWAWRADLVKDVRPDDIRFQNLAGAGTDWRLVTEDELRDSPDGSLRRIAAHHNWHTRYGAPRRQYMYANIGLVHFENMPGGKVDVVHSLYSWDQLELGSSGGTPAATNIPWPDARLAAAPYTEHRISLDLTDEPAPDAPEPP